MNFPILERVYYNNTVGDYLYSAAVLLAGFLLIRILDLLLKKLFIRLERQALQNSQEEAKNINRFKSWSGMHFAKLSRMRMETRKRLLKQILFPLIFMAFLAHALFSLEYTLEMLALINKIFFALLFVIVLRAAVNGAEISFLRFSRKESRIEAAKAIGPLISIFKIIIWILGGIFLAGNLGFDVTTAIAGLGISGIAIAIAAQGILGDLFGYFVILFDKPFVIGDLIDVNGTLGIVEQIGIKTTHLRTLQGELLIVSNTNLSSANLANYNKMSYRRVILTVGVTYNTSQEHIEMIPSLMEEIIGSVTVVDGVMLDRSHFKEFGDFSLNFETVYFVPLKDYKATMDVQQEVNQKVFRRFNELGIQFAFPTQTVYWERSTAEI